MKVSPTLHSLAVAAVALSSAAALVAGPVLRPGMASATRTVTADVALLDNVALIMGGSGTPIPGPGSFAGAELYLDHLGYGGYTMQGVFTPEGLYPGTGVKSLPLDTSVDQGVKILTQTIMDRIGAGDNVVAFGVSQSAVISSLVMNDFAALGLGAPDADQLSFVLLADEMFPNGGLLSRFAVPGVPLYIPSLGIPFYGGTPDDTPYHTDIYMAEYDGYSDFPLYPLNIFATLNAVLGIAFVHGSGYSGDGVIDSAELMLGSTNYDGPLSLPDGVSAAVNTDYYAIPTDTLPLLQLMQSIPLLGVPLYDLLEPVTRILVDLGYGNVDTYVDGELTHGGWNMGPANVATPFALFPEDIDVMQLLSSLGQGVQHGIDAFIHDLGNLSLGGGAEGAGDSLSGADFSLPSLTDFVNTVSGAASTLYSQLLPLTDVLNALFTTMPAYNISLFFNELGGDDDLLTNLVNAIGMPIAADVGLIPTAIGFDLLSLMSAVQSVVADFTDLFTA